MKHLIKRLLRAVYPASDNPRQRVKREWSHADGDARLRLDYPLDERSVVFDVGGFRGQWASDMFAMYGCTIHIFEPVPEFADFIRWRFRSNRHIHVHEFGLSDNDAQMPISLADDGSSIHRMQGPSRTIETRDVARVISELNLPHIDLMKVNIEGGEYALIRRLSERGLLSQITDVQVQFHDFVPDAEAQLENSRALLAKTHEPTYQYTFVWENWRRRA